MAAPHKPEVLESEKGSGFALTLSNFEGPFDLLLSLISKHELDITEIALSKVTDEFIHYVKQLDEHEEMEQASEFLVIAATLLDLKIVSLLPKGELVDAEDVALLEARDLLFARLLQYKAFKEAYQQEAKNAYAVGMAQAMKSTGDKPPLEKSTIKKAHDIAKSIEKSEK